MQMIIEIDEGIYKRLKTEMENYNEGDITDVFTFAIGNGTPLPKNHGRLIDADVLEEMKEPVYEPNGDMKGYGVLMSDIREFAPTIIKADKGNKK